MLAGPPWMSIPSPGREMRRQSGPAAPLCRPTEGPTYGTANNVPQLAAPPNRSPQGILRLAGRLPRGRLRKQIAHLTQLLHRMVAVIVMAYAFTAEVAKKIFYGRAKF
jgi:hypothetical protein